DDPEHHRVRKITGEDVLTGLELELARLGRLEVLLETHGLHVVRVALGGALRGAGGGEHQRDRRSEDRDPQQPDARERGEDRGEEPAAEERAAEQRDAPLGAAGIGGEPALAHHHRALGGGEFGDVLPAVLGEILEPYVWVLLEQRLDQRALVSPQAVDLAGDPGEDPSLFTTLARRRRDVQVAAR